MMETFFALLVFCAGNSPVTSEFPRKGQKRGALMFSLICARKNDWVNNREAGDFRRHHAHYDVTVMPFVNSFTYCGLITLNAVTLLFLNPSWCNGTNADLLSVKTLRTNVIEILIKTKETFLFKKMHLRDFPDRDSVEEDSVSSFDISFILTHWGRVTYIWVNKLSIICSDNDLSPGLGATNAILG